MEIKEKLKLANEIEYQIESTKSFINLIENGQRFDERYNGQNKPINLKLSADIWTGTQTVTYESSLYSPELISKLINAGVGVLDEYIKEKQTELENIIK